MTGQLFLRDTGIKKVGKNVYMIFGVVGLDEIEVNNMSNENQYTIKNLELINPIDMKEFAKGYTADGLLTQPIWRV